jgi:hypothetical protein
MRNYLILFFSLLLLSGCGGGGAAGSSGPTGSTIPVGVVSGTSFDGLVINGTVKIYDYTTGSKGVLLAQATTDGQGLYSLSLQIESRPVLLELTGGYYIEEAGSSANIALSTNHKLQAVANYTTGAALKVAVTTYSYLATGLAQYEISKGTAVSTAIDNANQRISSLVGVNILTTTPKEITDVANASATLTPELRYGFLAGAISLWTYNNAPSPSVAHLYPYPYTSIDFAQTLYQDISTDGVLDGFGIDSTGAKAQLSFGTVPLSVDVYRLGIGTAIVQMAGNAHNKTGLTGAQVLSFANSYIANTDPIFNNVAPTAFTANTAGIVTPATNQWARKTISIIPTASSPFGLTTVELLVDGVSVATSAGAAVPATFNLDTTFFVDGLHTVSVRATDAGGFVTTGNIQSKIDNTPPLATVYSNDGNTWIFSLTATDAGSGIDSVLDASPYIGYVGPPQILSFNTTTGKWWSYGAFDIYGTHITQIFLVKDKMGNCTTYSNTFSYSLPSGGWVYVSSGTC